MSIVCGGMTLGGKYDCNAPIIGGIKQLIIANYEDIDFSSIVAGTNPGEITAITMKPGGKAFYEFAIVNNNAEELYTMRRDPLYVGYTHGPIQFSVMDYSVEQILNNKAMISNRLVAGIKGASAPGNENTIFRFFGLGMGLQATEMTGGRNGEFGGAERFSIQTADEDNAEPYKFTALWDGDEPTTDTKFQALLTPST